MPYQFSILESGDTMRAAGLHAISTVLDTEAVLIRSATIKHPQLTPLIELITKRIAGVIAASKYVVCQYNISRDKLASAFQITPGRRAPTVSPLEEEGWVAISTMVEKKSLAKVMDDLVAVGAQDVLVFNLDNCRV
jgi:ATP phosphoribosyltransferase